MGVSTYRSLAMSRTPYAVSLLAILSGFLVALSIACLIYVPWQQSVIGGGKVVVLSPMQRPQSIEAQIPARLVKWEVQDGQPVTAGQAIAVLTDLDSKFLDPELPARMKAQRAALEGRREAARVRVASLENQVRSLEASRKAALASAEAKVRQAQERLEQARASRIASRQNLATTNLQIERLRALEKRGLRSRRDRELGELENVRGRTDLARAESAVTLATRDTEVAELELAKVGTDTEAGLASVRASLASAHETIAGLESDLAKLAVESSNVDARLAQRTVVAPCAGRVVRLLKAGAGETVKQGDVLAVLAPETTDLVAELVVSGNDAPLVSPGRMVRLQFAGWPAVQFTGWPAVAVGTFAGRVAVVDAIDDGKGQFRVLVKPDTERISAKLDEPWPEPPYLRPGADVTGWVQLDTVSLGFELWRQFNGFPPTVRSRDDAGKGKAGVAQTGKVSK